MVLTFNIAVLLNPGLTEGDDEALRDSDWFFVDEAHMWVALFAINIGLPVGFLAYELWRYYRTTSLGSAEEIGSQCEGEQQPDGVVAHGAAELFTETSHRSKTVSKAPFAAKGKRESDNAMSTFENPLGVDLTTDDGPDDYAAMETVATRRSD